MNSLTHVCQQLCKQRQHEWHPTTRKKGGSAWERDGGFTEGEGVGAAWENGVGGFTEGVRGAVHGGDGSSTEGRAAVHGRGELAVVQKREGPVHGREESAVSQPRWQQELGLAARPRLCGSRRLRVGSRRLRVGSRRLRVGSRHLRVGGQSGGVGHIGDVRGAEGEVVQLGCLQKLAAGEDTHACMLAQAVMSAWA
eukprot:364837-Chlamydomonas_euryale.AAC.15